MPIFGPETIRNTPYSEVLKTELKNPAFWEIFAYDEHGDLYFKKYGLKPVDLLHKFGDKYDAPIQITDLSMVSQRAKDLKRIILEAAETASYPEGKFRGCIAEKANPKEGIIRTALDELDMETSGELGLSNFMELRNNGLVLKDRRVISNGPKVRQHRFDKGYGEKIIEVWHAGVNITPVLGPNEREFFEKNVRGRDKMSVGFRLKFDVVSNASELDRVVSPFGLDWNSLQKEAELVKRSSNLKFTMLHAMSSAASAVNPRAFAQSALVAAEKYAILKCNHPDLVDLNLGGGFPSMDSGYNHQAFLVPFLQGVKQICQKYKVELPTIVIESGSFMTTDCEHLVFPVVDSYVNSSDNIPWLIIGGNLLSIPDFWIQEDNFNFMPANNAKSSLTRVRIHDLSCDSNSTVPTKEQLKANPGAYVTMTSSFKDLVLVAGNTGAYQDILGGIGSLREQKIVGHCGLPEPVPVYIWKDEREKTHIWTGSRASIREQSGILGFGNNPLRTK